MTNEVMLTIKGIQKYSGEEPLETITQTKAEFFQRGQSRYVMFEETQDGFTESVKSMLKIKSNCVELTKKGLIRSYMVFEPEQLYMTEYRTPFGGMQLGVRTRELQILETEDVINIQIKYLLESEEQVMADCSIQITIREKK